jgi:hypothetical protein
MNERVVVELTVDARGATQGTAEFDKAMKTAAASVDAVKAKTADLRLDSNLPRSVDRVTQAFEKLKASIDPVSKAQFAAQTEIQRAMKLTERAVLTGVITQQQADAAIHALRQRQITDIERVMQAQQRLNTQTAASANIGMMGGGNSAGLRRHGNLNAGFQIQDIFSKARNWQWQWLKAGASRRSAPDLPR